MLNNDEIISVCGDVCSECPRFTATKANNEEKLKELALLWFKLGFRDSVVEPGQMKCKGCSKDKPCGYDLTTCEQLGNGKNCGECLVFPCEKIEAVFRRTERIKTSCLSKCDKHEYDQMKRAFFMKREILTEINNKVVRKEAKDSYRIERCTMNDYNQIIKDICDFWGSDRTLHIHNPYLVHEFGNTAFVIKEREKVIAYMFGFFSQTESCAYVHLLAVREQYQRKGLGEMLYNHFIEIARSKNIKKIKAITKPINKKSVNFHKNRMGMTLLGKPNEEGINVVEDYSGENEDRVVFERKI
ncbi:MAG TPA: GNAT family N-acetyltransferase [Bacteroidales bacterium]|nr:GNAT family N-acetyltransferase [Bacteroidales bacterium]